MFRLTRVDVPLKVVKLVPNVDAKQQLLQTVQPSSIESTSKIASDKRHSKRTSSTNRKDRNKAEEKNEGEQLKTLLHTVEGIVRKYTAKSAIQLIK